MSPARVPLFDLSMQHRELQEAIETAVARVLASGQVILGPEVSALEEEIAHFHAMGGESMPALARAVPRSGWAGIYDDTPDYHPILDRLAACEGLYCAAGFSGHGFRGDGTGWSKLIENSPLTCPEWIAMEPAAAGPPSAGVT